MEDHTILLLFPTYATKARKVTGAGQEESARGIFTDRFSMLMAETTRNTTVRLKVAGLTTPDHMELQGDPSAPSPRVPPRPGVPRRSSGTTTPAGDYRLPETVNVFAESGRFNSYLRLTDRMVAEWLHRSPVSLVRSSRRGHTLVRLEGHLPYHPHPSYGIVDLIGPHGVSVISDIDDTIKISNVAHGKLALMEKALFEPSQEVPGMAELYHGWWERGAHFHYVSNSPWQLLPTLQKFFQEHRFPPGSAHLKMWDTSDGSRLSFLQNPADGKREAIRSIMRDFPHRSFILVGDSGQMDIELYADIAREFPDQVVKIFIRDITSPSPGQQQPPRPFTEPNLMQTDPFATPPLQTSMSERAASSVTSLLSSPSSPGPSAAQSRRMSQASLNGQYPFPATPTVALSSASASPNLILNGQRNSFSTTLPPRGSNDLSRPISRRTSPDSSPDRSPHPISSASDYHAAAHSFAMKDTSTPSITPSSTSSSWLPRTVSHSSLRKMVSKMSIRGMLGSSDDPSYQTTVQHEYTQESIISETTLYHNEPTADSKEATSLMAFYNRVDQAFAHLRDDQWELFQSANRIHSVFS
ncbi:hypothetical protein BJ085DRAFT_28777 [Dimargaris cristalligena]|uniref:Phosphatidate phosphatase APP1 catalytic domain-containing protein n=1 Tax=Dimargaris cristalligena TaxID=215637 RepID=A0A4P9ZZ54_9FUNG|nr:hypothetical protein BJ085DRAFT_28777 [Dimargaris cristalligena]|eukprot:RKP39046.1 hypothetical protein BJ085DRAFT_28777 [Dimargaris cristalligena]